MFNYNKSAIINTLFIYLKTTCELFILLFVPLLFFYVIQKNNIS
jgi:hypothetical protein